MRWDDRTPPPPPPLRTVLLLAFIAMTVAATLIASAGSAYGVVVPHVVVDDHYVAPDPVLPPVPDPWFSVAVCESGRDWDYDGASGFDGGLQFHPMTWRAFSGPHDPPFAWQASRWRQVEVAERVLAAQGWRAWPACSRKLGLR